MPPTKRNDLIDAAIRVFGQNGFHASGIELILREANVSRMTLYNHFASKEELVAAALTRLDEEFAATLRRSVERGARSPSERILAVFDYFGTWTASRSFEGCAFINAAGEYHDPLSAARGVVSRNKLALEALLKELCETAGVESPGMLAAQLAQVIQGAIVMAYSVDRVAEDRDEMLISSRVARRSAELLLAAALRDDT